MTTLTHPRGPIERAPYSAGSRASAHASAAPCLAVAGRFFLRALMVVAAASTITALMALKIAIYVPHFIHH
jgi:hypothetical protein